MPLSMDHVPLSWLLSGEVPVITAESVVGQPDLPVRMAVRHHLAHDAGTHLLIQVKQGDSVVLRQVGEASCKLLQVKIQVKRTQC